MLAEASCAAIASSCKLHGLCYLACNDLGSGIQRCGWLDQPAQVRLVGEQFIDLNVNRINVLLDCLWCLPGLYVGNKTLKRNSCST